MDIYHDIFQDIYPLIYITEPWLFTDFIYLLFIIFYFKLRFRLSLYYPIFYQGLFLFQALRAKRHAEQQYEEAHSKVNELTTINVNLSAAKSKLESDFSTLQSDHEEIQKELRVWSFTKYSIYSRILGNFYYQQRCNLDIRRIPFG